MTHSVARPPVASYTSRTAAFAAMLSWTALVGGALPATAQRAPDDTRPGGVEVRPSGPPPPAGADMSASPSLLFKKPTLTPPVLPTPAPAAAPAAATVPVTPPATPPPAVLPAAEKTEPPPATAPAATPDKETQKATPPAKVAPTKPRASKKTASPPRTGAARSFRAAPPSAIGPAGSGSDGAPAPGGSKMGDDRLPGGVERSPSRE